MCTNLLVFVFFFPDSERETGGSKALGVGQEAALQAEEEQRRGLV